jgi:hypothetical protein
LAALKGPPAPFDCWAAADRRRWRAACIVEVGIFGMTRRPERIGVALAFTVLTLSLFGACSSSETAVATAPTATGRCQITVSTTASSFTASGGSGTIGVTTDRDCPWSAAADVSWISINGAREGQGQGIVGYTVAPNPAPTARSGAIVIGSSRVALNQAAAPCLYSLSRSADSIGSEGGRLSFEVATLTGCAWTAASDAAWLTVASGQSGNATGTVTVAVAPNPGAARVGHITAGGATYTVTQAAAPTAPPGPTPTPPPPPPPSGTQVTVKGVVLLVTGDCPDVTLLVNLRQVVADRDTRYDKRDSCEELKIGASVSVDGIDTGSFVRATLIKIDDKGRDLEPNEDDDD